jgi:hypothetical protein
VRDLGFGSERRRVKVNKREENEMGRVIDFFLPCNCSDVGYRRYGNESRTKIIGEIEGFLEFILEQLEEGKRIHHLLGNATPAVNSTKMDQESERTEVMKVKEGRFKNLLNRWKMKRKGLYEQHSFVII